MDKNLFITPAYLSKKIKNLKIASFHTRNVPHLAHQWIHRFLIKKNSMDY